jgi:hypothetical protein
MVVVRADEQSRPEALGVLTDRNLIVRVMEQDKDSSTTPVSAVMTAAPLISIAANADLDEAHRLMVIHRVRRLLVRREGSGEVIGVLSLDDIALTGSAHRAGRVRFALFTIPILTHATDARRNGAAAKDGFADRRRPRPAARGAFHLSPVDRRHVVLAARGRVKFHRRSVDARTGRVHQRQQQLPRGRPEDGEGAVDAHVVYEQGN